MAIAHRFGEAIERAGKGELNDWTHTARSRLALIIVLDQLPRNAFRGHARAYALDSRAARICRAGIAAGDDVGLRPVERLFFYLPLLHSERLADQRLGVRCLRGLAACSRGFRRWLHLARRHRAIIAVFGRFPHRNAILARRSSQAERAYLLAASIVRNSLPFR